MPRFFVGDKVKVYSGRYGVVKGVVIEVPNAEYVDVLSGGEVYFAHRKQCRKQTPKRKVKVK